MSILLTGPGSPGFATQTLTTPGGHPAWHLMPDTPITNKGALYRMKLGSDRKATYTEQFDGHQEHGPHKAGAERAAMASPCAPDGPVAVTQSGITTRRGSPRRSPATPDASVQPGERSLDFRSGEAQDA
jgi:hypothetical protein